MANAALVPPISLSDQDQDIPVLRLVKTQPANNGQNPGALEVECVNGEAGVKVTASDDIFDFRIVPNFVGFVPPDGAAGPTFYAMGVRTRALGDAQDGDDFYLSAGTTSTGANGGDMVIYAGFGNTQNGRLRLAPFNTRAIELFNGPELRVVAADPNGVVTAPLGSLAIKNTVPVALYQNTDGATAWVAR